MAKARVASRKKSEKVKPHQIPETTLERIERLEAACGVLLKLLRKIERRQGASRQKQGRGGPRRMLATAGQGVTRG